MTLHTWEPIRLKDTDLVIYFKCAICGAAAGRHFPEWRTDRPEEKWLETTGLGEYCKEVI